MSVQCTVQCKMYNGTHITVEWENIVQAIFCEYFVVVMKKGLSSIYTIAMFYAH